MNLELGDVRQVTVNFAGSDYDIGVFQKITIFLESCIEVCKVLAI